MRWRTLTRPSQAYSRCHFMSTPLWFKIYNCNFQIKFALQTHRSPSKPKDTVVGCKIYRGSGTLYSDNYKKKHLQKKQRAEWQRETAKVSKVNEVVHMEVRQGAREKRRPWFAQHTDLYICKDEMLWTKHTSPWNAEQFVKSQGKFLCFINEPRNQKAAELLEV